MTALVSVCKDRPFGRWNWSCIWSLSCALMHQWSSQRSTASMLRARTDTQTQANAPADRSSAGQRPSGRVLLSPAGSWQMPRLLPVITLDLSHAASFPPSCLSPFLSAFPPPLALLRPHPVFSLPLSRLSLSRVTQVLVTSSSSPLSRLSCSILSPSSSVHSDELASLRVSSGLSQHGWVAKGRARGGLC